MPRSVLLCVFIALLSSTQTNHAAKILAVAPTYAISHFKMIQPLLLKLAERGHQVTVLSFYPQSAEIPNYYDIDLRPVQTSYNLTFEHWNLIQEIDELFTYPVESCNDLLSSEPVQKLLKSERTFDLIITEIFVCETVLGFPAFYKAPYIGFSPMALSPWLADWVWNPVEPSYVPDHICREADTDSLLDRGRRIICQTVCRMASWFYVGRHTVDLVQTVFNTTLNSLEEIKGNVSVMFVNTVAALGGVRPYLPNVIEIGGIHIGSPKELPENLRTWLDKCSSGVVLFSMGSMVQAATLKNTTRDEIIQIFGRLQECVLWKWEENIENLPKNIKTIPWLPQADVLGHGNIKLFVSHGGFHGLLEAIYNKVPVVGIPLYGDQLTNLRMLEKEGAALISLIKPFSPSQFERAINEVLKNTSYQENMRRVSRVTQDKPHTPLETALWWTEHVLRHNGAPHFSHQGVNLTWWQYYYLDIYIPVLLVIFLVSRVINCYFYIQPRINER